MDSICNQINHLLHFTLKTIRQTIVTINFPNFKVNFFQFQSLLTGKNQQPDLTYE